MGWDAFSSAKPDFEKRCVKGVKVDRLFKNAETYVRRKSGGYVDGYLRMGALDCSDCGRMLEKATGKSVCNENESRWSVAVVKEINKNANWDFDYSSEETLYYWSARKFLEVCAKAGLAIRFSM